MLVEGDPVADAAQEFSEHCLAAFERPPAEVRAVHFDQVESAQDGSVVAKPIAENVEDGEAVQSKPSCEGPANRGPTNTDPIRDGPLEALFNVRCSVGSQDCLSRSFQVSPPLQDHLQAVAWPQRNQALWLDRKARL